MKGPLLLGIDIGTSKIKICIISSNGKIVDKLSRNVKISKLQPLYAELDIEDLINSLISSLKCIASKYSFYIESIGLSVTSPTLILLDNDMDPVRPGILYLDNRSVKEVQRYVDEIGGEEKFFLKTGNLPSPSTCVVGAVNWIRSHEPQNWKKTKKICFLNSFLAAKLTGKIGVEPTIASFSGLFDIRNPTNWDNDLLEISGIDRSKLPDIFPSYYKIGGLDRSMSQILGLKEGIPVALGSSDTAAAAFALGLSKNGDIFESFGTSGVLTVCLDKSNFSKAFMNRCHIIQNRWLCHGAMSTAGAAFSWLLNNIFPEEESIEALERKALSSSPGANGVIFLPYLSGERSPIFDSLARAVFIGMSLETRKEDLIRAAYEGVAYGIKQIYSIAREKWNIKPDSIKCVGGGTKSLLALQIKADMLGIKYDIISSDYISSYGAALVGGIAAGIYKNFSEIPYWRESSSKIYPNVNNYEIYEKYFAMYKKMYPHIKEILHDLAKVLITDLSHP
jgi:xylulokinase